MNGYDDELHDQQRVKNTLSGDRSSFDALVHKYQPAAWVQAYQWTKNSADAQDILQIAFLQAYENLSQLKNPEKFAGWLRGIVVNACKMWQRGQKPQAELDEYHPLNHNNGDDTQALLETEENRQELEKVLSTLTDDQAFLVRLFYFHGFSYHSLSRFLDVPITTIESRLYKARRKLQQPKVRQILENLRHIPPEILEKGRKRMPKVEVKLAADLVPMCKTDNETENLINQISALRSQFLKEKQLTIPPVRVRDNIEFDSRAYRIEIEDQVVYNGELLEEEFAETIVQKLADSVQAQAENFK